MKVAVCQLDNRPEFLEENLAALAQFFQKEQVDFLLLPEMCFSEWLAVDKEPDDDRWKTAVKAHEQHIAQLHRLNVEVLLGTRPIINPNGSYRNQAYLWTSTEGALPFHEKYYLPDEPDFWENSWYDRGQLRFELARTSGMRIGVQICTEMWFFEWARHYAKARVDLLCVPRATPHGIQEKWLAGGQAAAVCSGAYCLSSNLWNPPGSKANLGGGGWIIDPNGRVLAQTDENNPIAVCEIDLNYARESKKTYPRYVRE